MNFTRWLMEKKSNGNIQALLAKIDALSGSKELPEKYTQILRDFVKSYQEVILSHFEGRDITICFDFPAGHIDDNRALVFGADVEFTATKHDVTLIF